MYFVRICGSWSLNVSIKGKLVHKTFFASLDRGSIVDQSGILLRIPRRSNEYLPVEYCCRLVCQHRK